MNFSIYYDKQPEKFLSKSDKHIASRLIDKIENTLSIVPVPHNAIAIAGKHGIFRIKIGDYRAVYRIDYEDKKIIIIKLDKRENVYD